MLVLNSFKRFWLMYIRVLKMNIEIKLIMNLLDYLFKLTILIIENYIEIFYSMQCPWTIKNIDTLKNWYEHDCKI